MSMPKFKSVDDYINSFPKEVKNGLESIRQIVKQEAPEAQEKLSYGIPYYSLNGRLLYFGAFKNHYSLFAMSSTVEQFKQELSNDQISKGTIRFPFDKPLPLPLIRKMIIYRVKEVQKKLY